MSYKVTTVEDLEALPLGSVVVDADGGLYRKRSALLSSNAWVDIDASIRHGEYLVEDSHTILWQSTDPHAFVVWVPGGCSTEQGGKS